MKKSFIVAALIAAFVFASCEQSVLTGALPSGNAAIVNASNIAPQVTQPTAWVPFTPLPFTSIPNITAVAGLATDGANLVAAGYDRPNSIPYASFYNGVSWSTPAILSSFFTLNPGAAHYLNGYWLITAGSTSVTGAYSSDGLTWTTTGNIGFGTKVGLYTDEGEGLYVVAGQNGQAAYTDNLANRFTTISQSITGWSGSGGAAYINAGAYNGEVYVFGGGSGRIAWTKTILDSNDDLVVWTEATTTPFASGDFVDAIAYGCNTFVAVGDGTDGSGNDYGIIAYSTDDGENWTLATYTTIGANAGIFTLAYADCYFTAIDDDGNAAYSTDGINWQPADDKAFIPGASPQVNAVVYYDAVNAFVAGGQNAGITQMGIADPLFPTGSGN